MTSEEKGERLLAAIQEAKNEEAKRLIQDPSTNVNYADETHLSVLEMAVRSSQKDLLCSLLKRQDLDLKRPNFEQDTCLHITCSLKNLSFSEILLQDPRTDVNAENKDGASPFFIACQIGDFSLVKLLACCPNIDVNKPNKEKQSPLWIACFWNNEEAVEALLASGRSVDTRLCPSDEMSPALKARKEKNLALADLIDQYEADQRTVIKNLRAKLNIQGILALPPPPPPLHLSTKK